MNTPHHDRGREGSSAMTTDPSQQEYEIKVQDAVYQTLDGVEWLTRIYQPIGDGPFPTIVEVHGECWSGGDRTKNKDMCEYLATHGVLCFALEYHQPPNGAYPDPMQDINVAVRWVKAHAAEYGGMSRVGAFGSSSGGQQVTLLAVAPNHPLFSALPGEPGQDASLAYVIGGWPVLDPLYRYQMMKNSAPDYHPLRERYLFNHDRFWGTEENMAAGSAQVILDSNPADLGELPPLLICQREVDKLHPREMQDRFVETWRANGGEVEMVLFPEIPTPYGLTTKDGAVNTDALSVAETVLRFIGEHA